MIETRSIVLVELPLSAESDLSRNLDASYTEDAADSTTHICRGIAHLRSCSQFARPSLDALP
jgi:hypothetical protein